MNLDKCFQIKNVMIQTTSFCNSSCVMCPSKEFRAMLPQGEMKQALFENIINELSYNKKILRIMPYLMNQLNTCRSKSVPQFAESILCAVTPENEQQYLGILDQRMDILSVAQQKRVKKLLKKF